MTRRTLPSVFSDEGSQSPFFQSLQKEIDRVFDRFRGDPSVSARDIFAGNAGRVVPALDIAETDDAVEISAEIPGVKEDDLDISIVGDALIIKGEKSVDREEKEKDYHLVERRYGTFRRSIPLGFTPADNATEAKFSDGVLSLRISKPAEAVEKTQKITIGS